MDLLVEKLQLENQCLSLSFLYSFYRIEIHKTLSLSLSLSLSIQLANFQHKYVEIGGKFVEIVANSLKFSKINFFEIWTCQFVEIVENLPIRLIFNKLKNILTLGLVK